MTPNLILLQPADAARYARLRLRMLEDSPWAFASSPEDDMARDLGLLAAKLGEAQNSIVAVEGDSARNASGGNASTAAGAAELVAAAGVVRMKPRKSSHRASIWGVFVLPEHRGRGLGRKVVETAIGLARSWPGVVYVDISVSMNSPAARELYERLGFEAWGREPEALEHGGRRFDEVHLSLRL
jgi:ribosomal protein S18 acetylase RimI-like enzyme